MADKSSPNFGGFPVDKPRSSLSDATPSPLPISSLSFRPLNSTDRHPIQVLHEECFPVRYTPNFYDYAVRNLMSAQPHRPLFSLIALPPPEDPMLLHPDAHADKQTDAHADAHSGEHADIEIAGHPFCVETKETSLEEASLVAIAAHSPLVGAIITQFTPSTTLLDFNILATESYPLVMYILTLATTSSYRRNGLARHLLAKALSHARSNRNVGAVYLHVITYNAAAIRFYEREGFRNLGTLENYYFIDGVNHDAFLFVLHVNGATVPVPVLEQIGEWVVDKLGMFGEFMGFGKGVGASAKAKRANGAGSEANLKG